MLRCAIYARYSSEKQNQLSIEDQIRKCQEFAKRQGWTVLEDGIYSDEAVSGVGGDRPGLTRMLEAALSSVRPFNTILIDDTSRISRNVGDAARIYERLNFAGLRVIAVSQGIDSQSEQSDVLLTVHGLVDALYVKELSKKTHRGLEGLALRGLHTGGRCYGYRNVRCEGGVKLEVDETEAVIVRRIFETYAAGRSLRTTAEMLNAERTPPARPRAGKRYATWCPTAIQAMLRRELYIGRIVWNRSRFIKAPGTNKRLRRLRPRSEWCVTERPELRIISDEVWQRVQSRLAQVKEMHGTQHRSGLLSRSASSRYLLSGFLKCGICGANLAVVTGRNRRGHPKYGCPQNFYRGACLNNLQERQEWLEQRLLADLQEAVLRPETIEYALEEFGRQLKTAQANASNHVHSLLSRKNQLEAEIRRLAAAVAESGHSAFLMEAIGVRERQLASVEEELSSAPIGPIEAQIGEIRQFIQGRLLNLRDILYKDVPRARAELGKHVAEIHMLPQETSGDRYYVASGEWDLLGACPETDRAHHLSGVRARLVAGAGFEPATFGL